MTHTSLTASQHAFLAFHAHRNPVQWKWHMLGTQLRATSERGRSVTLEKGDVSELLQQGLLRESHGSAVELTDAGRLEVKREREREAVT